MQSPVLVVLAAGLGSRYGGIKQMDPVGPCGEFVIDYSVFDAWRAGFKKVVFVIREELEQPLREHFGPVLRGRMDVAFACQRLGDLPSGFRIPQDREKPWGTAHAVWSARDHVGGPFAVINADDFYGRGAYTALGAYLRRPDRDLGTYAMVAYRLANTLSEHGSVSRGICEVDADGFLAAVVERTRIEKTASGARCREPDDGWIALSGDELASLNLWGFDETLFGALEQLFRAFLSEHRTDPKAEFFIPTVVDELIRRGQCRTRVLPTEERWFGMTYREDRQRVTENVRNLIRQGMYPEDLWGSPRTETGGTE